MKLPPGWVTWRSICKIVLIKRKSLESQLLGLWFKAFNMGAKWEK